MGLAHFAVRRSVFLFLVITLLSGCWKRVQLYPGRALPSSQTAELDTEGRTVLSIDGEELMLSENFHSLLRMLPGTHTVIGRIVDWGTWYRHFPQNFITGAIEFDYMKSSTTFEAQAGRRYSVDEGLWNALDETSASFAVYGLVIRDKDSDEIVRSGPPGEVLPWVWADSAYAMYPGPVRPPEETALLILGENTSILSLWGEPTTDDRTVRCDLCQLDDLRSSPRLPVDEWGKMHPFDRIRLLPGHYRVDVRLAQRGRWARPQPVEFDLSPGEAVMIVGALSEDKESWHVTLTSIRMRSDAGRRTTLGEVPQTRLPVNDPRISMIPGIGRSDRSRDSGI